MGLNDKSAYIKRFTNDGDRIQVVGGCLDGAKQDCNQPGHDAR